jgi:hypothetical protein
MVENAITIWTLPVTERKAGEGALTGWVSPTSVKDAALAPFFYDVAFFTQRTLDASTDRNVFLDVTAFRERATANKGFAKPANTLRKLRAAFRTRLIQKLWRNCWLCLCDSLRFQDVVTFRIAATGVELAKSSAFQD